MSLVLDTSMALAWCFLDERTDGATAVLQRITDDGAHVPSLWHLEIGNALQVAVRRGRITLAFRDETLTDLSALPIIVDAETDQHAWLGTLALAEKFQLTLYDAAYLELAHRMRLPLASYDEALQKSARGLGVALIGSQEE